MKKIWMGSASICGYELWTAGESEDQVHKTLLTVWRQHAKKGSGHHLPAATTWAKFAEHFETRVQEVEIGKVVWP